MRDMLFLIILMNRSLQISLIPIDTKLFGLQRPTPDTFQSKRGYQKQLHQCNKYKANQMCGHYAFFFFFCCFSSRLATLSIFLCQDWGHSEGSQREHSPSLEALQQCAVRAVHSASVKCVCRLPLLHRCALRSSALRPRLAQAISVELS